MRKIEGGDGEYAGFYGEARSNPCFNIETVTHRKNPIYLGLREQRYPSESALVNGKSSQAEAFKTLVGLVPGVIDLRCDVSYEAIVTIKKLFPGPSPAGDGCDLRCDLCALQAFNCRRRHRCLRLRQCSPRSLHPSPGRSGCHDFAATCRPMAGPGSVAAREGLAEPNGDRRQSLHGEIQDLE